MGMPRREVEVGGHRYSFYLVKGSVAFKASRKFIAHATAILSCLSKENAIDQLNERLTDLIMNDFDDLFNVFIDKNQLYCDGSLITDFDEHFAGRYMEIPQLLYKVILENDRDFFTLLPTLIEKGLHKLNERLQANSLQKAEGFDKALTSVANSLKENLG